MEKIIVETALYYMSDPTRRGIDHRNGVCNYYTPDGRMCAVGRCMLAPQNLASAATPSGIPDFENKLKPRYRGHS
ncbi:hypothetical protein LCGC14_2350070, partial [marine sediment metagenome]